MNGTILVLGASGHVGRPLVKALRAKGERVRAATRAGGPVEGAEGVAFDLTKPLAWAPAFKGVDRAFVMLPGGHVQSRALLTPVIEALAARGVKIVLMSVFGADADDSIPYRQVELALERSGTRYVILRPNWFADNFLNFWKAGIDQGLIGLPAGEGRSSFIDARDIAESAAAALTNPAFEGRAFNLTGPQTLSYAEAAALIGAARGQAVRYESTDDTSFIAMLVGAGVPRDYAEFLAAIFHPVREGWTAAVTPDVQTLTGHAPRDLKTYLADHLDALRA